MFSVQETSLINCFSGLQVMQTCLWLGVVLHYFVIIAKLLNKSRLTL